MRITRQQMQARVQDDAAFVQWYIDDVMRTELASQYYAISTQGKHEMVLNGRKWARRFGLSDAASQAHFITLMWKIGAGFFVQPGFAEIFGDTKTDERAKIAACYDLDPELATDALLAADDRYWYPVENGLVEGSF